MENHKADALCTSSIATFDERGDFFRAEGSEAWAQVAEHAAAVAGDFYHDALVIMCGKNSRKLYRYLVHFLDEVP